MVTRGLERPGPAWEGQRRRRPGQAWISLKHNCPRADGIKKKTFLLQQQAPSTPQSPNKFTIVQERMVFKKSLPSTAAITLDFTIPQQIHNRPRADGIEKKTCPLQQQAPSTSQFPNEFTIVQEWMVLKKTCHLQQQAPSTSQSPNEFTIVQERMVKKNNLPPTAAITLDFTIPQRVHNCSRADGI